MLLAVGRARVGDGAQDEGVCVRVERVARVGAVVLGFVVALAVRAVLVLEVYGHFSVGRKYGLPVCWRAGIRMRRDGWGLPEWRRLAVWGLAVCLSILLRRRLLVGLLIRRLLIRRLTVAVLGLPILLRRRLLVGLLLLRRRMRARVVMGRATAWVEGTGVWAIGRAGGVILLWLLLLLLIMLLLARILLVGTRRHWRSLVRSLVLFVLVLRLVE